MFPSVCSVELGVFRTVCIPVPRHEFRRQLSRRSRAVSTTPSQARLRLGPRLPGHALHQANPESRAPAGIHTRPENTRPSWSPCKHPVRPPGGARQFPSVSRLEGFSYLGRASFKMLDHISPTKILTASFILHRRRGASLGWELHKVGDSNYSTSVDLLGGRSGAKCAGREISTEIRCWPSRKGNQISAPVFINTVLACPIMLSSIVVYFISQIAMCFFSNEIRTYMQFLFLFFHLVFSFMHLVI